MAPDDAPPPSPEGIPRLTSAHELEVPGDYWFEACLEHGQWMPVPALAVLPHHAVRIDLTNLDDFPELAAHAGDRMRFEVHVVARELRVVDSRSHAWRNTLRAQIRGVRVAEPGGVEPARALRQ